MVGASITQTQDLRKRAGSFFAVMVLWSLFLLPPGTARGDVVKHCVRPPKGLLAWWTGDADFSDRIGNNDGTPEGDPQAGVPGLVGGAFELDGVDDGIITSLILPDEGAIELWVRATPMLLDDIHGIVGTFGQNNGNDRLWVSPRGPTGGLSIGPNKYVVNTGSCCINEIIADSRLILGTWAHLAVTWDYTNDAFHFYVNGVLRGSSTADRTAPTRELLLGVVDSDFGQTFFFPGLLDEVTVYDRELTAGEILAIFRAGAAGKCKRRFRERHHRAHHASSER